MSDNKEKMNIVILTGICGSGKTFYCRDKISLSYDSVFSYSTKKLNYEKIDSFILSNKSKKQLFLDAFNKDLINYIINNYDVNKIECKLLYTDIDDVYNCIAITEPRNFNQKEYDNYVQSIIITINSINNHIKSLKNGNIINEIKYLYRNKNNYIEYNNELHLLSLLNQSKKDRLLEFIDNTSGDKNYQSIILDKEYIRKGTEQDWITLENILDCTKLKDKVVVDTGCFNGYFSFKALELGAKKVIGIDHNIAALNICRKLAIYNHFHIWENGQKTDNSCQFGINFYEHKIGIDNIFNEEKKNPPIDIIFALNYLHHLINSYGKEAFINVLNSFFQNSKEVIFEVNDKEIDDIIKVAEENNFILNKKIESHRKTGFGNRWILHFILLKI